MPIEYDIPVLFIIPFNLLEQEEGRYMYRQINDIESDRQGVRLPKVYFLATGTGGNDEKPPKAAQALMHEEVNG